MRATSSLTRMGAAAREQLRGASAVGSKTDEPRPRALHRQHSSRANARETEQMSGDSFSGGAHFSMCTFDRAECKDGSVLAAGGAAIRGSSGRSSEFSDCVLDRNSSDTNHSGRTFVMYHGTTWRHWLAAHQAAWFFSFEQCKWFRCRCLFDSEREEGRVLQEGPYTSPASTTSRRHDLRASVGRSRCSRPWFRNAPG